MDPASSAPHPAALPVRRGGRLIPPLWLWGVLLVLAALIPAVRGPIAGQHAVGNILTLILAFAMFASLAVWFCLFSGYPRGVVRFLEGATLGVALLTVVFVRIDDVNGDLVPTFAWRFSPPRDARLGELTPAARLGINPGEEPETEAGMAHATAHDFPEFLGPGRRPEIPKLRLVESWKPDSPEPMWRRAIGAGWSGCAIVNGLVVTLEQRGEKELVSCYRLSDGEPVWSHAVEARHETILGGIGPRSTPTIHGGRVYALGATGLLRCLRGDTGELLWQTDLLADRGLTPADDLYEVAWGRSASPLLLEGVPSGAEEGAAARDVVIVPGGGKGGKYVSLLVLEAENGEIVGRWGDSQISYASPIEAELHGVRQVIIVNQAEVASHDPRDGALLWRFDWPGSSNSSANTSQPVPLDDRSLFISKGYGGGAARFELLRDQAGRWDAELRWHEPNLLNTKLTNVTVFEGHAYGLSDGILECVRLANGKRLWKRGRYGHGQVLRFHDLLLVVSERGEVAAVRATPERYEERWRFQAVSGKTWNPPAFFAFEEGGKLEGRLLVRNGEEMACYRLLVEPIE